MKASNYLQRVQRVLAHIDSNFENDLKIDELSDVANFSKFHFHRIFTALVGMPLNKYIQYLKLKRAAYQLSLQKETKIVDIAFAAGFDSHEAFSRAFKKYCGVNPANFRKQPNWQLWQLQPYKKIGEVKMKVEIRDLEPIDVVCVKHRGDYHLIKKTVAKLTDWASSKNIELKAGEAFGIAYDDPDSTDPKLFRFDFCIIVPSHIKVDNPELKHAQIPGGRYAVAQHLGSHDELKYTVYNLYREWLPLSNEELRDEPCFFQYHNYAHEVQESALITEVYLPLK